MPRSTVISARADDVLGQLQPVMLCRKVGLGAGLKAAAVVAGLVRYAGPGLLAPGQGAHSQANCQGRAGLDMLGQGKNGGNTLAEQAQMHF